MDVDRRTVKRNLMNLLDFDFGIDYTEIIKKNEKGEEIPICTDWYITREFDDSEIRLLIDSVLFSKTIPQKQCKKLIDKLKGLSNIYFELELSSQMQRYIKINFKRRFPVQAFAWTLI